MNRESSLFQEISEETGAEIAKLHLGTTAPPEMRLMEGGMFNTTYLLTYGSEKKKAVLRLGPVNRHLLLDFEMHLMEAEQRVYTLMEAQGVPCPKIIALDLTRKLVDRDYMLTEYVESTVMAKAELSEQNRSALYRAVGQQAAQIHQIKSPQFGYVYDCMNGKGTASWYACVFGLVQDIVTRAQNFRGFSGEEAQRIFRLYERHHALLDEIKEPRLVHTDLWEANILLREEGFGYGLALIIDGDRALFGEPDFEFASQWMINSHFLAGYGEDAGFLAEKRVRRRALYHLAYDLIDTYVGLAEYNRPEQFSNGKARILEALAELGAE